MTNIRNVARLCGKFNTFLVFMTLIFRFPSSENQETKWKNKKTSTPVGVPLARDKNIYFSSMKFFFAIQMRRTSRAALL